MVREPATSTVFRFATIPLDSMNNPPEHSREPENVALPRRRRPALDALRWPRRCSRSAWRSARRSAPRRAPRSRAARAAAAAAGAAAAARRARAGCGAAAAPARAHRQPAARARRRPSAGAAIATPRQARRPRAARPRRKRATHGRERARRRHEHAEDGCAAAGHASVADRARRLDASPKRSRSLPPPPTSTPGARPRARC